MLPPLAKMIRARRCGMAFQMLHMTRFGTLQMSGRMNAHQSRITARPGA